MRIKQYRGANGGPQSGEGAVLSVRNGGVNVAYYPSAKARETISRWPRGAAMEWDVDDDSQQPLAIYLTPAQRGGFIMRDKNLQPHFILPCSAVGRTGADPDSRRQVVDETVTEGEITVTVPFTFVR